MAETIYEYVEKLIPRGMRRHLWDCATSLDFVAIQPQSHEKFVSSFCAAFAIRLALRYADDVDRSANILHVYRKAVAEALDVMFDKKESRSSTPCRAPVKRDVA